MEGRSLDRLQGSVDLLVFLGIEEHLEPGIVDYVAQLQRIAVG